MYNVCTYIDSIMIEMIIEPKCIAKVKIDMDEGYIQVHKYIIHIIQLHGWFLNGNFNQNHFTVEI